ncbi:phage baseplate assembly protein V [Bombella pollinis]|uniref:Phage baseplate assembly protein V n=1 Tax=Bombella pollinis TaxID=2967337 RepID=A0ABT3WQJ4_9PROT|nr:phage baseplate assembly protein V [Bombella pollinis]MCX5619918.1 phage baseplate assembly protein V [Bombella pollinis]
MPHRAVLGDHDNQLANTARLGVISEVQDDRARVKIGATETDLLPFMLRRAAEDYDWWQPSIGEQVVVLMLWGDPSQGVILGAVAQDAHRSPAAGAAWGKRFRDGTVLTYDPESHALTVAAWQSPVTVVCSSVTIKAHAATLDVPEVHCTGSVKADGDVTAGSVSLQGHVHQVQAVGAPTGKPQ